MDVQTPIPAVVRYADRFHTVLGGGRHHVASPLGAWLVLALAGEATSGEARTDLEGALGCDVATAAAAATALLTRPHPLVGAAAAFWVRPYAVTDALRHWRDSLPEQVETGDIPSQQAGDAWARRHSLGLIDRFPLALTPEVLWVLASALATRVSWRFPFTLAPAADLGADSPWSTALTQVLRTPYHDPGFSPGHRQFIAATHRAGEVAVHIAAAVGDLEVVSVAAAADVAPDDVLAAAHHLATSATAATGGDVPGHRSLFDLPLGDGPAWTIREVPSLPGAPRERCAAVLPAWSATSNHDLMGDADRALGFAAAGAGLAGRRRTGSHDIAAFQSAVARYSRTGFEAAAVTALARSLAYIPAPSGPSRVAELRFARPYAVVAVATGAGSPWSGLPLFSAWITEPEDAS